MTRWGSEEAFENEMSAKKADAEAAYDALKQAFNDQAEGPVDDSAGPPSANGENPRRLPPPPRILGLGNEMNHVGVAQEILAGLLGEEFGFYTVVNDAYFDGGPTVRVFLKFLGFVLACGVREEDGEVESPALFSVFLHGLSAFLNARETLTIEKS